MAASLTVGAARAADWVKSLDNPMLSLGEEGDFDYQNIMGPSVTKYNGQYYLYYAGGPNAQRTQYQLGLALSDDGVHWTKTGEPLLELGERDNFHVTPALLRNEQGNLQLGQDGLWHMCYTGNRADDLEHATSPDGLNWTKDALNPLYENVYAPNLVQVGDELRMYYTYKGTSSWQIRMATGPDIYSLQFHDDPVLTVSQSWESGNLFYPYVLREESTWVMYYASYTVYGQNTAIGMATSSDGVTWTKNSDNPVLEPTPGSPYDSTYTSSQSVIRDGDHYKMYYAARINQNHKYYSINLATKSATGEDPGSPSAAYTAAVLADGPIAYWQFEDGELGNVLNGQTAKDSVGEGPNGNHPGTYMVEGGNNGVELVAGVPGIGGLGGRFVKGSGGEYVLFDTLGDFGSTIDDTGATFEFWAKNLQADTTNSRVFGVWNERPGGDRKTQLSFSLHRPENSQELFLRDDADTVQEVEFDNTVKDLNDGQWHHVAWVIEPGVAAGGMIVYVDGVEVTLNWVSSNEQTEFADFDKGFIVGGEHAAGFDPRNFLIDAVIDEFAVYDKVLTLTQIQSHLRAMLGIPPGDANGDGIVDDEDASILAAHWQQAGMSWEDGDFSGDGVVDDADASILAAHWQETAEGSASVPEPASLAMLAGVLLSLLLWRRRR
jgi:predicted GH43/DUF377 family glycosyl hydrolase